jgi:hypothetical protein
LVKLTYLYKRYACCCHSPPSDHESPNWYRPRRIPASALIKIHFKLPAQNQIKLRTSGLRPQDIRNLQYSIIRQRLSRFLANDQLDAQFFSMYLFQFSTCDHFVCTSEISFPTCTRNGHQHRVTYTGCCYRPFVCARNLTSSHRFASSVPGNISCRLSLTDYTGSALVTDKLII